MSKTFSQIFRENVFFFFQQYTYRITKYGIETTIKSTSGCRRKLCTRCPSKNARKARVPPHPGQ